MQESGGNQYRIFPSPAKLGEGRFSIAASIENRGGGSFLDLNSGRAEGFTPIPRALRSRGWGGPQCACSPKTGSTEPCHGPWYCSKSSSAGVSPRATLSSSG